jgi:hypothetical protein
VACRSTCLEGENAVTLAYLDAGSGSIIASALVGGVAAAGVAARQARAKLGGLGRRNKPGEQAVPPGAEPTAPDEAATGAVDAPADAAVADEATTGRSDT